MSRRYLFFLAVQILIPITLYSQNINNLDSIFFGNITFSNADTSNHSTSTFVVFKNPTVLKTTLKDLAPVLAPLLIFVISLLTLAKGVKEYRKAQLWKKAEFVSKEVKDFFNDYNVSRAIKMLDWNYLPIEITESEKETFLPFFKTKKPYIEFNDKLFTKALRNHYDLPPDKFFTGEETIIRLVIDDFINKLGIFNQYIKNSLISVPEIQVYLKYVIDLICKCDNRAKPKETILQLQKYIKNYGGEEVIELCHRFGFNWRV